ncbi:unnamed protein product [Closterium sp. NIES-54]
MVAGIRVKGEPDEVLGCPTCMQAKFTRFPFSSSDATAKTPLDEVVMDVVGPLKLGVAGAEFFLTIVDVNTRMTWVYVLSKKSDVAETVKTDWLPMVERQQDRLKLENEAKIGMRFGEVKSSDLEHVELPLELSSGSTTTRQFSLMNGGEETKDVEEEEEEVQQVSEGAPTLPSRTMSAPRIRVTPPQCQGLHVPAAEEEGRGKRRMKAYNRLTYDALGKPVKSALAGAALMVGDDEESDYEEYAFAFFSPVQMPGEPESLKEALKSSDSEEWKKAMESELKSIEENSTWELGSEEESVGEEERRHFHSLLGSLIYAAVNTQPGVAFATEQLARVFQCPNEEHVLVGMRVAKYLGQTVTVGLQYSAAAQRRQKGADGVEPGRLFLTAFSDASYAPEQEDMTSVGGFICCVGGGPAAWESKKQVDQALSTVVSEYMALFRAVTHPTAPLLSVSALVTTVVVFASPHRLDDAVHLVSGPARSPSSGGAPVFPLEVLEDRQFELGFLAAAVPYLCAMLLAREGDPDALDIPIPRSHAVAVLGPLASYWIAAEEAEMASYRSTGTYVKAVPPPRANVVSGMWLYKRERVDFFQTFAPTPKMTTLWVLLHIAGQRDYEVHSLDFSTTVLQGSLHEQILLRRPPRFTGTFPPRTQWQLRMTLAALDFFPSSADPSLFVNHDSTLFIVLVYIDDLRYLGLQITKDRAARTITLTQSHMVEQILTQFRFPFSKVQPTLLAVDHGLTAPPLDEPFESSGPYPELVGCLMYLMTCTRPDLACPLSVLARFVAHGRHLPSHWYAAKRVAKYVASTSGMGLVLGGKQPVTLTGFTDSSWADNTESLRSTQGYCFCLGTGAISWRATRASSVSSSSCKAKVYATDMAAQELRWLSFLLTDLGERPRSPPVLFGDNRCAILLCKEPRLVGKVKHSQLHFFLLRELQQRGQALVRHVVSEANTADIFTKALPPFTTLPHVLPALPCDVLRCARRPAALALHTAALGQRAAPTGPSGPRAALAGPSGQSAARPRGHNLPLTRPHLALPCSSSHAARCCSARHVRSPRCVLQPRASHCSPARRAAASRVALQPRASRQLPARRVATSSIALQSRASLQLPAPSLPACLPACRACPARAAAATTATTTATAATSGGQMQLQRCPRESLTPQQLREWYAIWGCGGSRRGCRLGAGQSRASGSGQLQLQRRPRETLTPQQLREWYAQSRGSLSTVRCPYVIRTGDRTGQACGTLSHTKSRCFARLSDAWRTEFGDEAELPYRVELLGQRVDIFALDYDAILTAMYALPTSADRACYLCVPPDPGIETAALGAGEAAALGASASPTLGAGEAAALGSGESALSGTALVEALYTFTLNSGASRSFRDSTTLTPLSRPIPVSLADPSGGPVLAHSSAVLPCPAVPSGSLSGLHLPSFSTNLVNSADLQDQWVEQFTPGGQCVTHCTCSRTGRHLATFTRAPSSSLYTLTTVSPQVAASASAQLVAPCSCRALSHQTLLWHHRLGHPSVQRLHSMHRHVLVSGLPWVLPPLPPSPTPPCLLCVEGRQRAAPQSSSFPPTEAPLQTLYLDVWGPVRVCGRGHERYFLLVVDDYTRYTTVFPLQCKGDVPDVLIPWIRAVHLQLRETFQVDFPVLRLHSDRGGEFSSDLLAAFCAEHGIRQTFTLPASPEQNKVAERHIGLVMEVTRTSMIRAAAPHFLWPFAVRYAAHQLNLWPCVSLPETLPTLLWTGKVGNASRFWVTGDLGPAEGGPARGAASGGAEPGGAETGGAEPGCEESGATVPGSTVSWGAAPGGAEASGEQSPWSGRLRSRSAGASQLHSRRRLPLSPQQLREWYAGRQGRAAGARGPATGGASAGDSATKVVSAGGSGAAGGAGAGGSGAAVGADAGGSESAVARSPWSSRLPRGSAAGGTSSYVTGAGSGAGPGGARTGGTGAARARGAESGGAAAGDTETGDPGTRGAGFGGAAAGGAGPGGAGTEGSGRARAAGGAGAAGAGGTAQPHFPPSSTGLPLQPGSPLPAPSTYTEQTGGLTERRERASRPVSPVRSGRSGRRVPRSRQPAVTGTHLVACRPSSPLQRVPLPSPPVSSLPTVPEPESESTRAAHPTVTRLLTTVVTDPPFESAAASALVAELVDFAAACRLDYAASLVAESGSVCPPSVGGECALGTDVLDDRQEDLEYLAAAAPHLVSMLLAPEGDPDAPNIPTPHSYAVAITGTYVDEVPPPGANIVSGMWIFRVKWPPGSPRVFKACYVARGFNQREGVEFFHTFSPTPKMTTLRVLLHVAAQRDYELHSLDFNTAFLQGSLHEEIWLHRPPGFTGSFPLGTQWSLRRPVYGLRQAPREWHDTLRTTLAALGFAPSTADPSLFLRTDTSLPPFDILVYVDDLVFATADTEALALVKSELQKRHTCTNLVLQRFNFTWSSAQATPLATGHSLSAPPSNESVEPSGPYPELVGCLMYLMTCTHPDLAYPLGLLARYVAPGRHRKVHMDAAKRVIRYLCSTSGMGLVLGGRSDVVLTAHSDASWVDDQATQRSSQG